MTTFYNPLLAHDTRCNLVFYVSVGSLMKIFLTERRNKMKAYKGFLTAVLLAAVLTGSFYAQKNSIRDITANDYALQNLIAGIHSENDGVRRSSIYFAGYYKVAETEDALIEQLKNENDASTRILIALVLYELGSHEGLLEVKKLAKSDEDAHVRRMSTHIYNEYLINDSDKTASLTK